MSAILLYLHHSSLKNKIMENLDIQKSFFEEPELQVVLFGEEEITADSYTCFLRDNISA
jgi:hypothetical protein